MSNHPLFTQKHYEHMIAALLDERRYLPPRQVEHVVDVLCRMFQKDNPKFKASMFRDAVIKPDLGGSRD